MGETIQFLRAPSLLVATPQVLDPFFYKTVVFLTHHDVDHSVGVILNRPTEIPVSALLRTHNIAWRGEPEARAWFGGPVEPTTGVVLYKRNPEAGSPTQAEITMDLSTLSQFASDTTSDLRLMLGYAAWGPSQLDDEIARNDWIVVPVDDELLFLDPAEAWNEVLDRNGIRVDSSTWFSDDTGEPN